MTDRSTVTFGSVQRDYINSLRSKLLDSGGVYDLNFTRGVNLSIVIAMAHNCAEGYAEKHGIRPQDAPAQIVADYLQTGDVPQYVKDNYDAMGKSFMTSVVHCTLTDSPGFPTDEKWDEMGVDREEYNDVFTAEVPDE
jgi:hypothetical protein